MVNGVKASESHSAPKRSQRRVEGGTPPDSPAHLAAVRQLARWWMYAVRTASGNPYWKVPVLGPTPWADPKQVWWWNSFVLLERRLREWGADPQHFLAAIMASYLGPRRGVNPNPRQVTGPKARAVWEKWLAIERAKWAGRDTGADTAGILATESADDRIRRELRDFYVRAEHRDGFDAFSGGTLAINWTTCSPDTLSAVYDTEPALRPFVEKEVAYVAQQCADHDGGWSAQWTALRANPAARLRAVALRADVLGTGRAHFPQNCRLRPTCEITLTESSPGNVPKAPWYDDWQAELRRQRGEARVAAFLDSLPKGVRQAFDAQRVRALTAYRAGQARLATDRAKGVAPPADEATERGTD